MHCSIGSSTFPKFSLRKLYKGETYNHMPDPNKNIAELYFVLLHYILFQTNFTNKMNFFPGLLVLNVKLVEFTVQLKLETVC